MIHVAQRRRLSLGEWQNDVHWLHSGSQQTIKEPNCSSKLCRQTSDLIWFPLISCRKWTQVPGHIYTEGKKLKQAPQGMGRWSHAKGNKWTESSRRRYWKLCWWRKKSGLMSSICLVSLQLLHGLLFSWSVVSDSVTPWTAAYQASLPITSPQSPPKHMSIESVMPSNHLILCCPLLLPPSIFSSTRVFSNESALHIRWPKDWSFSVSPPNEYSGLISFRIVP